MVRPSWVVGRCHRREIYGPPTAKHNRHTSKSFKMPGETGEFDISERTPAAATVCIQTHKGGQYHSGGFPHLVFLMWFPCVKFRSYWSIFSCQIPSLHKVTFFKCILSSFAICSSQYQCNIEWLPSNFRFYTPNFRSFWLLEMIETLIRRIWPCVRYAGTFRVKPSFSTGSK